MQTLLSDPLPPGFGDLLKRRRLLGLDTHDEIWEGVLRIVPPASDKHSDIQSQLNALLRVLGEQAGLRGRAEFGLGDEDDFRVPDGGLVEPTPARIYRATAALVVEILSPGDDTWRKLDFYAARDVDELLIVDPDARAVHWLALRDGRYEPIQRSGVIALGVDDLVAQIDWEG